MSATSSITKFVKVGWRWIKLHKSTIMVAGGCVLYGKAIYDTGKQTVKAVRAIDNINTERLANDEPMLTRKETFKEGISYYIQPGIEFVAATVLVAGGYKIAVDKFLLSSAGTKVAVDKYEDLTHAIDEYFGDDVEEKDRLYKGYHQSREDRIYGDSNEPVDRFSPAWSESGYSKMVTTHSKVGQERFKDFVGTNIMATEGDIRAAIKDIQATLMGGNDAYLSDFYDALPDSIEYPRVCTRYIWEADQFDSSRDIESIDYVISPDRDSEGLFNQITFTGPQPTYID